MGKANRGGQKRKEAPARKQLQGRGGNSGLLHKNNHKQQHAAAGLDGEGGREGGRRGEKSRPGGRPKQAKSRPKGSELCYQTYDGLAARHDVKVLSSDSVRPRHLGYCFEVGLIWWIDRWIDPRSTRELSGYPLKNSATKRPTNLARSG